MTYKIRVRLVGGMADGQTVNVEDMQDGWPFRAAVIPEGTIDSPILSGPEIRPVEATFHIYKLASLSIDSREFRYGIPNHWDAHDALAHLFGPSRFRS